MQGSGFHFSLHCRASVGQPERLLMPKPACCSCKAPLALSWVSHPTTSLGAAPGCGVWAQVPLRWRGGEILETVAKASSAWHQHARYSALLRRCLETLLRAGQRGSCFGAGVPGSALAVSGISSTSGGARSEHPTLPLPWCQCREMQICRRVGSVLELLGAWVYSFPFQTTGARRAVTVLLTHSHPQLTALSLLICGLS